MQTGINKNMQSVVFSLGKEEYGIEIGKVQEIIRLPAITRLPNTADYILGIINLRGCIIPVVDTKKKFMLIDSDITDDTRIIVIEIGGKRIGLIVDEVSEVINIADERIVPADNIGTGIRIEYILGVARFDNRLLILLNADKILG
ncbi:chemotaxis protein CheW [Syntrophomonas palmitatica]|uniref:chemotaxis protein CheW n=1 Tax=Syntrophomonas palmitatica TaxID=402877 RepID=UPI0006D0CBFB|nr:chemotaxis protein CheW [Syntrophomonas palmitatica]